MVSIPQKLDSPKPSAEDAQQDSIHPGHDDILARLQRAHRRGDRPMVKALTRRAIAQMLQEARK